MFFMWNDGMKAQWEKEWNKNVGKCVKYFKPVKVKIINEYVYVPSGLVYD